METLTRGYRFDSDSCGGLTRRIAFIDARFPYGVHSEVKGWRRDRRMGIIYHYAKRRDRRRRQTETLHRTPKVTGITSDFVPLPQFFSNSLSRKAEGPCPMMPWQPLSNAQKTLRNGQYAIRTVLAHCELTIANCALVKKVPIPDPLVVVPDKSEVTSLIYQRSLLAEQ